MAGVELLTKALSEMEERLVEDEEQLARVKLYMQRSRSLEITLAKRVKSLLAQQAKWASLIEEREKRAEELKTTPPTPYNLSISDGSAQRKTDASITNRLKVLQDCEKALNTLLHVVAERGGTSESGGVSEEEVLEGLRTRGWFISDSTNTPDYLTWALAYSTREENERALISAARDLGLVAPARCEGGGLVLTSKGRGGYNPGLWDVRMHLMADCHEDAHSVIFQALCQQVSPFLVVRRQGKATYVRKSHGPQGDSGSSTWTPGPNGYYTLVLKGLPPGTYVVHARQWMVMYKDLNKTAQDKTEVDKTVRWGPTSEPLCFVLSEEGSVTPTGIPPGCEARPDCTRFFYRHTWWAEMREGGGFNSADHGVVRRSGFVRGTPEDEQARVRLEPASSVGPPEGYPEYPNGAVPALCHAVAPLMGLEHSAAELWKHVRNVVWYVQPDDPLLDLASPRTLPHKERIKALKASSEPAAMVHCIARALLRRVEVYALGEVLSSTGAAPAAPTQAVGNRAYWPPVRVATDGCGTWAPVHPYNQREAMSPHDWDDTSGGHSPWYVCRWCGHNGAHAEQDCPQAPEEGGGTNCVTPAVLSEAQRVRQWYVKGGALSEMQKPKATKGKKRKAEGAGSQGAEGGKPCRGSGKGIAKRAPEASLAKAAAEQGSGQGSGQASGGGASGGGAG